MTGSWNTALARMVKSARTESPGTTVTVPSARTKPTRLARNTLVPGGTAVIR